MLNRILNFRQISWLFLILIFIPKISFAETHANVHKENGEEVYEPKAETKKSTPMKQKEETSKKSVEKQNSHSEHKPSGTEASKQKDAHATDSHGDEKKDAHATDSHGDEKKDAHAMDSAKSNMKEEKEHKSGSLLDRFKNNKLVTLEEEDPYEVRKPMGIFWFAGVFLILLIVIFIFT
ncbi:hypothetical protein QEJ31_01725 [Pigmentibacter sp. JX0631]|uniref:hypothetical protein n=1 Tax=Pigmentibacter sp. JX0631 TaxID=2976982 RepID=UPI002468890C|nr:hypothetical protein [Pigmentibacter sp. JX0631]WGL60321.1 hypothetical protein QEJ31_01725 [Pigmentibacter sp. JX0631]